MPLPHLRNSQAGVNKWDAAFSCIFEAGFTVPEALRKQFSKDEFLLTEHVLSVTGLDALNKAPETGEQKFMGTSRSYINPGLDSTRAEIEVHFSLNLRDGVDNVIFKILKAWAALGYDIDTGARSLKKDYCADWMMISIANQAGDIYDKVVLKDVMIGGPITGMDELNYTTMDARELTVKFVSDWWSRDVA